MSTDATANGETGAADRGRVFARALQKATSDVKGISGLLLTLGAAVASYIALKNSVPGPRYLPEASAVLLLAVFYFFYVHPEWQEERRRHRLNVEGIKGRISDPTYFRLSPYGADDREQFGRPDGAVEAAIKWITSASVPLLYLSGLSGAGKSSLLAAAVRPALVELGWVVVALRPHDDALGAIRTALLTPQVIWQKPPSAVTDLRELLERAAERARQRQANLILIIDQFEEALILGHDAAENTVKTFLVDLVKNPISGLVVLLSLRAEYLNDLVDLGLPPPNYEVNAFEVRPFKRVDAQAFIEASGISAGPGLLDKVLKEAAEIEDMPDRVRPIIINMFGLVVASFQGSLPKGVNPGRLLSGYVERCLNDPMVRGEAVAVLRPLVTDVGTKRALSVGEIAQATKLTPNVVRGCLIRLAGNHLVRSLDKEGTRWEIAHDFIARLLQPLVQNWRETAWAAARRWVPPVALSVWIALAVAMIFFFATMREDSIFRELRAAGLVPGLPDGDKGATVVQNGAPIPDQAAFWRRAQRLEDLGYPVSQLQINNQHLSTVEGMPALPALASLYMSSTSLTSLEGMPALPALENLDMSSTSLTSLEGMPALPALANLDVSGTGLTSLEGMPALPALDNLDVSGTGLTTLEGMSSALPALASLDMRYNSALTSLQGMPALPALANLDVSGSGLTTLEGMPALPALANLDVSGSGLTTLEGMPALPALAFLNVSLTGLTRLEGMPALPALASLNVTYNSALTSLQGMPALPALANLDVSGSGLASLEGMPALSALASLDLTYNSALTSLQGMPALPTLANLHVSSTGLTSLEGMPALPALANLDVTYNGALTSLQGMPALPALASLDVRSTGLTTLEGMPVLPALTSLDLRNNPRLTSLGGLPSLPALEDIFLDAPRLSDPLPAFPKLQRVCVDEIPTDQIIPAYLKQRLVVADECVE